MPDAMPHSMLMIDGLRKRAEEFDVLHFHIDLFHFPLFHSLAGRTLTTLHGRQDLGDLGAFYSRFREMPLVSHLGRPAQSIAQHQIHDDDPPRHSG